MLTTTAYDTHVEQLFDRVKHLHELLTAAGVPYRIVGGVAVYLHVAERDPLQARITADVDAGIQRADLPAVIEAVRQAGWTYRHVAGVDMLAGADPARKRSSVHLVFLDEKVRPDYVETVPSSAPTRSPEGFMFATVADLIHMKLTSYRLKDRVHIQDLDAVGLIGPEIETELSEILRARLAEIRATE